MSANTAKPPIRTEMRGLALWIWIDREERRNAINKEVISGIESAVTAALSNEGVRSIVLTGAGRKAFSQSIRLQPNRIKTYLRYAASFLPRPIFRKTI